MCFAQSPVKEWLVNMQSINISDEMLNISLCTNNEFFENSSSENPIGFGPQYHRTARIILLVIMICLSLIGNVIVGWQLLPLSRRRFPKSKILFLLLAIADLTVTFFTMITQTIWEIIGKIWLLDGISCKFFKFGQTYSLTLSTYVLVAIAVDRHNAIVRPFARNIEPRTLCLLAAVMSLVPSAPCFFVFRKVLDSKNITYCVSIFYSGTHPQYWRQLYMAFIFLSIFIIPFILLVCLYSRILFAIRAHSFVFSNGEQSASSLPRARTKTLKMALVIFLMFIVTNLPYVVQEMILAFGDASVLDPNTVALFGVISASNSSVNPYIYLAFQSKETCLGRTVRQCLTALRSPNSGAFLTSNGGLRNQSFPSSKTSSRVDINAHSVCHPTQTYRVTSVNHLNKRGEETFL